MQNLDSEAPPATAARLTRHMLPSWSGCALAGMAFLVLGVGLLLATAMGLTVYDGDGQRSPGVALFLLSVLIVPVAALFAGLGAATSPRSGGRALLLLATSLVLVVGNISCGQGLIALKTAPPQAWVLSTVSFGGLALVAGAAGLALLGFTPRQLREQLERDRRQYVRQAITTRGGVAITDLGAALEISASAVMDHLVDLVANGELNVRLEERADRVYAAAHVREQQERLRGALEERGRTRIADLAGEMAEPQAVVEGWIGELLMAERVIGTIDRERGLFVWDPHGDAGIGTREFQQRDCDSCGGLVRAIGGGLFRCVYCGTELEAEA